GDHRHGAAQAQGPEQRRQGRRDQQAVGKARQADAGVLQQGEGGVRSGPFLRRLARERHGRSVVPLAFPVYNQRMAEQVQPERSLDFESVDRTVMQVFNSFEEAEHADRDFWLSRTPEERMIALEHVRQVAWGYSDAEPESA